MPARSTAEMWTNTSFPPSAGWMKPKPFCELKNLTVPVAMTASIENADWRPRAARHSQPYVRIRRCLGKSPGRATTRTGKISNERLYGPRMRRYQPPSQESPRAARNYNRDFDGVRRAFPGNGRRDPEGAKLLLA